MGRWFSEMTTMIARARHRYGLPHALSLLKYLRGSLWHGNIQTVWKFQYGLKASPEAQESINRFRLHQRLTERRWIALIIGARSQSRLQVAKSRRKDRKTSRRAALGCYIVTIVHGCICTTQASEECMGSNQGDEQDVYMHILRSC